MALVWLLACTDPGLTVPEPIHVASAALRGAPSQGPAFDAQRGQVRHRGRSFQIGPTDGWVPRGARASREEGPVTRWWQRSAAGLEFGATLHGPAPRVVWEVPVGLVDPDGEGGAYLRGQGTWLHIYGLKVVDATGRVLPATLETGRALTVVIDLAGAVYPVEVDPLVGGDWATPVPGNALAWLNVDGDAYDDFAIGDAFYDGDLVDEGRVVLFQGDPEGPAAEPAWTLSGGDPSGFFGTSLGPGDFNGDGLPDLAVGSPGADGDRGRVDIYLGDGETLSEASRIEGTVVGSVFGMGALAVDVDRDGYDDLLVTMSTPLGVWLYLGGAEGVAAEPTWSLELEDEGIPVITLGDVNGDGWHDLAVGMENAADGETGEGTVGWMYGGLGGFGASFDVTWSGDEDNGKCGHTVAMADWNVDGFQDTAVSCPYHDEWFSYAGRILVFSGSSGGITATPDWEVVGITDDRTLGLGLSSLRDLDGDGADELLVAGQGDFKDGPGQVDIFAGSRSGLGALPTWSWAGSGEAYVATIGEGGGDFNGDGYHDLLLASGLVGEPGRTWLLPGDPAGMNTDAPGWRADEFGSFADSLAFVGDMDDDGTDDLLVGAVDDEYDDSHVYGYPGLPSGLAADPLVDLTNYDESGFGAAAAAAGDVNGDGFPDAIVGAPLADGTYTDAGAVYLYLGDGTGLETTVTSTVEGSAEGMGFGRLIHGVGDTNGDGYADVVVALPDYDGSFTDEGRIELYGGAATGLESVALVSLDGGQEGAAFGASVASAGDVDGDGRGDLLLGATGWTDTEAGEGKAELWLGDGRGLDVVSSWTVYGGAEGAELGRVAGGGDVDGDGAPDVAVGAPELGEVRVYVGFSDTSTWSVSGDPEAEFGGSLAFTGDLDGDGDDELVIGAAAWNDKEGAVWVFAGETGGVSDVPALSWRGGWPGATFGAAFSAGDADGDGLADLAISSPGVEMVELWYGGPLDGDGDGVKNNRDCDDEDANISPGATETEDGRDEDCDGVVDNPPTWYADLDGDAYGDDLTGVATFAPDAGWVARPGDCDDTRADVYPGADERCDGVDQDCDETVDDNATDALEWWTDEDGDGAYGTFSTLDCEGPEGSSAEQTDCDDADSSINPDAAEVCDGIDNDCSGVLDDDAGAEALAVFLDADADGYGDEGTATFACEVPEGWVDRGGDCDDANYAANPRVTEVCNGVDDDCSGAVDDDALDAVTRYADEDGDLHGTTETVYVGCSIPAGYVSVNDDCDDADDSVYPEADERCDGMDDDCDDIVDDDPVDGTIWHLDQDGDGYGASGEDALGCEQPERYVANELDCDDLDPAIGLESRYYQDVDADGWGDAAATGAACSLPDGYTVRSGDCDDLRADVYPGTDEVCDDADQDCDGEIDEDPVDLQFWYTDADGDGFGDSETGDSGCAPPADSADNPSDCDDTDATVGLPTTAYPDRDGDGFGDDLAAADFCGPAEGFIAVAGDCDDTDATISPLGVETCDGVDEDCDGRVDNDTVVPPVWHTDADGDGFGNPATAVEACAASEGEIADGSDCDDTDPAVYPGAVEVYYDGVEQSCAGVDGDQDGDGAQIGADCDDRNSAVYPGAPETVGDTVDSDCDGADPRTPLEGKAPEPEACGCAAAPQTPPGGWLASWLLAGWAWRGRRTARDARRRKATTVF